MIKKTKKLVVSKPQKPTKLSVEEQFAQNETCFWQEVAERSKDLIANLIERNLPISATPKNFDCEKSVSYRLLLRDDLPRLYADNEEYQAKITNDNWTEDDVEYVAEEVSCWYFQGVLKGIIADLSDYSCYEHYHHIFANLTNSNY